MADMKNALKGYVEVKDRIKAFLEDETKKGWYFSTEIVDSHRPSGVADSNGVTSELGYSQVKCTVYNEKGDTRATGYAQEVEGKGMVNKTSYLENCETSAIGRALGMLGYGIDAAIASKEEIEREKAQKQPTIEIYESMYITEEEMKSMVLTSISELIQKLGARKEDVANMYAEKTMGGSSKDASLKQLQNLEKALRTANNEDSDWHSIYGQNYRIKEYVPKNQEIIYTKSIVRMALKAYEMAKDDDTRLAILEYFEEINLRKYVEVK